MADKVWFKIGETAKLVGATPKELRYWEKVIPELRPRRSKGNLRYYHQEELARLQRIRQWLAEGLTVADCSALLQGQATRRPLFPERGPTAAPLASGLEGALEALRALWRRLGGVPEPPPGGPPEPRPRRGKRQAAAPVEIVPSLEGAAQLLDVETAPEVAPDPEPPSTKRTRKLRSDPSPLGRMWSEGRLPLDWEE